DLFHRVFDRIELGAERAVDHAAAELHDQPADNRGIDLHVDLHVFLCDCMKRALDRLEMRLTGTLGERHFGTNLALMFGNEPAGPSEACLNRTPPGVSTSRPGKRGPNARQCRPGPAPPPVRATALRQ